MPTGLSINNNCVISGTPSVTKALTTYTVTAQNGVGQTQAQLSFLVGTLPSISYNQSTGKEIILGSSFNIAPTLNGNGSSITSCYSIDPLPAGVLVNNSNCTIYGTPTSIFTDHSVTIRVSNSFGSSDAQVSFTVKPSLIISPAVSGESFHNFGAVGLTHFKDDYLLISNIGEVNLTNISANNMGVGFEFTGGAYPGIGAEDVIMCQSTIPAQSQCYVRVRFTPVSDEEFSGAVSLNYALNTTANLSLKGFGVNPASLVNTISVHASNQMTISNLSAGDLIILIGWELSSTFPDTPAGWTLIGQQLANSEGSDINNVSVWYRFAATNGSISVDFTKTGFTLDRITAHVFRNASPYFPIGQYLFSKGNTSCSEGITFPTYYPKENNGSSLLLAAAGHRAGIPTELENILEMTKFTNQSYLTSFISNTGIKNFPSQSVMISGEDCQPSNWLAWLMDIQTGLGAPGAVQNLRTVNFTPDKATIAWDHPTGENVTEYIIQRANNNEGAPSTFEFLASTNRSIFSDITIIPNEDHWYRVKALNEYGEGIYSAPMKFTNLCSSEESSSGFIAMVKGNAQNIENGSNTFSATNLTLMGAVTVGSSWTRNYQFIISSCEAGDQTEITSVTISNPAHFSTNLNPGIYQNGTYNFTISYQAGSIVGENTTLFTISTTNGDYLFELKGHSVPSNAEKAEIYGNSNLISNGIAWTHTNLHTDFGVLSVPGTISRTFTVKNANAAGGEALEVGEISISGADQGNFSVSSNQCAGASLSSGQTCTFTVLFDSLGTHGQTYNAWVTVLNSDVGNNPYEFPIKAQVTSPVADIRGDNKIIENGSTTTSESNHTFSKTLTSIERTYTISQTGTLQVPSNAVTLSAAPNGLGHEHFTVIQQPIEGSYSWDNPFFRIRFTSPGQGSFFALVTVNFLNHQPYTFVIEGYTGTPRMQITGNNIDIPSGSTTVSTGNHTDFGTRSLNTNTDRINFSVRNPSSLGAEAPLQLTGEPRAVVSGPGAGMFTVTLQPGSLINVNGSSSWRIRYRPTSAGCHWARISIASNDPLRNPYTFVVRGNTSGQACADVYPE
jgi:hypothetical protein